MDAWLVADAETDGLARMLSVAGVRHGRLPMGPAKDVLRRVPSGAVLVVHAAPGTVLRFLREARLAGHAGRVAAMTGPLDARILAALRALADAVADRRRVDRATLARLLGGALDAWSERPARSGAGRADAIRAAARACAMAAALAEMGGNVSAAAVLLGAPVQRLRRELQSWDEEAAFLASAAAR